jgi:hypothetical protein
MGRNSENPKVRWSSAVAAESMDAASALTPVWCVAS